MPPRSGLVWMARMLRRPLYRCQGMAGQGSLTIMQRSLPSGAVGHRRARAVESTSTCVGLSVAGSNIRHRPPTLPKSPIFRWQMQDFL